LPYLPLIDSAAYFSVVRKRLLSGSNGESVSTVNVLLRVRPGKREEFLQSAQSIQKNLKAEVDLSKSSLFQDMNDTSVFCMIQEWATQDSMERYIRSERFSVLMGMLKVLCVESEIKYQLGTPKLGAKLEEI
jgi:quinol monooxygenase YgiN